MTQPIAHPGRRLDASSEFSHIALGLGLSLMLISAMVVTAALSAALI